MYTNIDNPINHTKKTQGDTFLELVQGYLWPWHAETAAAAPGSQAWG